MEKQLFWGYEYSSVEESDFERLYSIGINWWQQCLKKLITMYQKKSWTDQEDNLIRNSVKSMGDRPRWKSIAEQVNQLPTNLDPSNRRTAKQCRQRWHNKLDPQILDKQWDQDQINKLFNLHNEHGNKWSLIATMMNGRTDNCVKNKFYSALRKGMRKINKYIVNLKRKLSQNKNVCIKEFKDVVLTKLIAVADKKYDEKLDVKENSRTKTEKLSQAIKLALVQVSKNQDDYFGHVKNGVADEDYQIEQNLFKNIQQFCRNCKRKKGKRKSDQEEQNEIASQMIEESEEIRDKQSKNQLNPNIEVGQKSQKMPKIPSVSIKKNKNSKQFIFQQQKNLHNKYLSTFEDLKDKQISSKKKNFDVKHLTSFTKANLSEKEQEPQNKAKPDKPKLQSKQKHEEALQIFDKNLDQQPQFFFFENIRNVQFQRTDQNGKLAKDFKPQEIFKQGNPSQQPLQPSQNQLSISSSNPLSGIQKSQSFFNLYRSNQTPQDINHGMYYSSSFSSSSNKQHEKIMELMNSRSERKDDIQTSQAFAGSFNFAQSLQLDDLFKRIEENKN